MKETETDADHAWQQDDYSERGQLPRADAGAVSVSYTTPAAHHSPSQVLLAGSELCLTHGLDTLVPPGWGSYFAPVHPSPGDSSLSLMFNPTVRVPTPH